MDSIPDISRRKCVRNVLRTLWIHFWILFCVVLSFLRFDFDVVIHTGDPYVIFGRMMTLNNVSVDSVDNFDFRQRSGYIALKLFSAFTLQDSMCLLKFNFSSIIIPRYYTSVFRLISDPLKYRPLVGMRFRDLLNLKRIAYVFSQFTLVFHFTKYLWIFDRASDKFLMIVLDCFADVRIAVSSA